MTMHMDQAPDAPRTGRPKLAHAAQTTKRLSLPSLLTNPFAWVGILTTALVGLAAVYLKPVETRHSVKNDVAGTHQAETGIAPKFDNRLNDGAQIATNTPASEPSSARTYLQPKIVTAIIYKEIADGAPAASAPKEPFAIAAIEPIRLPGTIDLGEFGSFQSMIPFSGGNSVNSAGFYSSLYKTPPSDAVQAAVLAFGALPPLPALAPQEVAAQVDAPLPPLADAAPQLLNVAADVAALKETVAHHTNILAENSDRMTRQEKDLHAQGNRLNRVERAQRRLISAHKRNGDTFNRADSKARPDADIKKSAHAASKNMFARNATAKHRPLALAKQTQPDVSKIAWGTTRVSKKQMGELVRQGKVACATRSTCEWVRKPMNLASLFQ